MVTRTKTVRTLVAVATSNTAGSTTRGTGFDLETTDGGYLTLKMTNGGTGPTLQCEANILIAHNATLPTLASAGADWKTIASFGGGVTANDITERSMAIHAGVMNLSIEFTGNTGQTVTVEAILSELAYS